jgi:hypothetical protein
MRRIKMLEYALRVERCGRYSYTLSVGVTRQTKIQTTITTGLSVNPYNKALNHTSQRRCIISKRGFSQSKSREWR